MGNESLNIIKSAGKNLINEIANELSESGITESLIKNGIPVNKMIANAANSSKGKNTVKNKSKSSNKKKNNKNKNAEKSEDNKEKNKQALQKKVSVPKYKDEPKDKFSASSITTEQLRDAVVWAEILGEPVSRKRRKKVRQNIR